jgi:hypothetical protein
VPGNQRKSAQTEIDAKNSIAEAQKIVEVYPNPK